jgi:hypothetical protein
MTIDCLRYPVLMGASRCAGKLEHELKSYKIRDVVA